MNHTTTSMSNGSNTESPDLKELSLVEVVEDIPPPPAYDTIDSEAAIPSFGLQPVSRPQTFFFTILYTVAFTIATLVFCLQGSLAIGFPHDERAAGFARVTYASILGSVLLGPVYFTSQRFMISTKAKHEIVNIHLANGRLLKALGRSVLLCALVIGVVASAASLGYGLMFWPVVYSETETAPTEKMAIDAALIPVACLLGGLRWAYEMVNLTMWILIRIPKISTGFEGTKYDRTMKIAYVR
jgi:hypothetical protein